MYVKNKRAKQTIQEKIEWKLLTGKVDQDSKGPNERAHFRVHLSLSIKARSGAQPFIWKWV